MGGYSLPVVSCYHVPSTHGDSVMTNPMKEIIGGPIVIGGRELTLSKAVRAGDFVFLTGQVPMQDGSPMTSGSI